MAKIKMRLTKKKKNCIFPSVLFTSFLLFSCSASGTPSIPETKEETYYTYEVKGTFDYPRSKVSKDFSISLTYQNFSLYDSKEYHEDLSNLGAVLSTNIYDTMDATLAEASGSSENDRLIFDALNMKDYRFVSLKSEDYETDKNDTASFQLAHFSYRYQGKEKEVVFIVFMGTANQEEWLSDMDLGGCQSYLDLTGSHPDYTSLSLHKGIDVAYERSLAVIEDYLSATASSETETSLFITGHSRGGALANLAGAHFEKDTSYRTFTYTFASPKIVRAEENDYETIFNIVNRRDFVPAFVPDFLGYSRYGKDFYFSPSSYKDTFKGETCFDYADYDLEGLIDEFEEMAADVESIYTFKEDEDHLLFSSFKKGPYETEEEARNKFDTSMSAYLEGYSEAYYSIRYEKEEDGYYIRTYNCPMMALEAVAFIANNASDTAEAAYQILKAAVLFSGQEFAVLTKFISCGGGIGTNHEMFTYLSGIHHLEK